MSCGAQGGIGIPLDSIHLVQDSVGVANNMDTLKPSVENIMG